MHYQQSSSTRPIQNQIQNSINLMIIMWSNSEFRINRLLKFTAANLTGTTGPSLPHIILVSTWNSELKIPISNKKLRQSYRSY